MSGSVGYYIPVVPKIHIPTTTSIFNYNKVKKTIELTNVDEDKEESVGEDNDFEYDVGGINEMYEDETINVEGVDENIDEEVTFVDIEITDELFMDGKLLDVTCNLNSPFTSEDMIYDGCEYTLKEFCRYLLCLKNTIMVGDFAFCSIIGAILCFMPSENRFTQSLGVDSTVYHHLKVINYFAEFESTLQTFKFDICDEASCVIKRDGSHSCIHEKKLKKYFYYMPVRQRVEYLLRSDLRNFLLYPKHKYRSLKVIILFIF